MLTTLTSQDALLSMINNILDLAKMDAGQVEPILTTFKIETAS